MDGHAQIIGMIVGFIVGVLCFAALVWMMLWVMRDAEARGKPPRLIGIMVFLFQIPGLLLWLAFRPEKRISHRDDL
jgi:uncharacterized iron-regulated membrane protein